MTPTGGRELNPWLARLAALRQRGTWVWLHRWIGLVMTLFLIVAGLTGSFLPFYGELDAWVNPHLLRVTPPTPNAPMLDAITLRERAQAARPQMHIDSAPVPYERESAVSFFMEPRHESDTDSAADDELFLNPYTGEVLGSRRWGAISQGMVNLLPFMYQLHYSLALGTIGNYAFGIVALLWTLDCFIGAYLTFPRGRPFFEKWRPAWGIKRKRCNYDLHRSSGLWVWAMLFVLAWSSVALNLHEVYEPVTRSLLGLTEHQEQPELYKHHVDPGITWQDAYFRGKELMTPELIKRRITNFREDALHYNPHRGEFSYWMATRFKNKEEASDWFGVTFDGKTGALVRVEEEATGAGKERAGDFVTRWLVDLHMAKVWGLPYRIFVCVMGIVVVALSITGVVIWWRKRRGARKASSSRPQSTSAP